ncbi:hypothetical protein [Rubritalea tangerina]|uniref:hypothetical protein n=1 Tax=Rubritalea tangerina TaxID=430798 RepID=UPI0036110C7C
MTRKALKFFTTLLTLAGIAYACQVPVFRYALERWETDKYALYLVTPKPLSAEQTQLAEKIIAAQDTTNFELNSIVLEGLSERELWQLPEIDTSITEPTLMLFAPAKTQQTKPLYTTSFTGSGFQQLVTSPVRKQLVKKLIAGTSCIWIVIHNNKPQEALAIQQDLDKHLAKIETKIEIADAVVETDERHTIDDSTDLDDVLRSSIPLKIEFGSLSSTQMTLPKPLS